MSKPDNFVPPTDENNILSMFTEELKKIVKDSKNVEGKLEITDKDTKKKIDIKFKVGYGYESMDSLGLSIMPDSKEPEKQSGVKIEFKPFDMTAIPYIISIMGTMPANN